MGPDITQDNHSVPVSVLSVFAEGIAKLSSEVSYLSRAISLGTSTPASYSRKRHKPQNESPQRDTTEAVSSPQIEGQSDLSNLFAGEHLEHLVDAYFQYVHPWIPMIHMATFRRRMKAFPKNDPPLILYAILVGALRFVDPTGQSLTAPYIEQCVEQSRNKVILAATKDLSVDNLQALIIVAFSHVSSSISQNIQ